jgi:Rod binding domain-containing protein
MIDATLPAAATTALSTKGGDSKEKVQEAARQFEALLIGQMLKSTRESEGGWMGTGDDEAGSSAMEYAQEMFAQALSARGGLGLATLVVQGLDRSGQ